MGSSLFISIRLSLRGKRVLLLVPGSGLGVQPPSTGEDSWVGFPVEMLQPEGHEPSPEQIAFGSALADSGILA